MFPSTRPRPRRSRRRSCCRRRASGTGRWPPRGSPRACARCAPRRASSGRRRGPLGGHCYGLWSCQLNIRLLTQKSHPWREDICPVLDGGQSFGLLQQTSATGASGSRLPLLPSSFLAKGPGARAWDVTSTSASPPARRAQVGRMRFPPDQWAVILGGSSGFGLATAQKLAEHGMNLLHRAPRPPRRDGAHRARVRADPPARRLARHDQRRRARRRRSRAECLDRLAAALGARGPGARRCCTRSPSAT